MHYRKKRGPSGHPSLMHLPHARLLLTEEFVTHQPQASTFFFHFNLDNLQCHLTIPGRRWHTNLILSDGDSLLFKHSSCCALFKTGCLHLCFLMSSSSWSALKTCCNTENYLQVFKESSERGVGAMRCEEIQWILRLGVYQKKCDCKSRVWNVELIRRLYGLGHLE